MKKVLLLAYYYPPIGGAGVQRVAKFVKYLPDFGYTPVVVAGTGGASDDRMPNDRTLLLDDSEVSICYTIKLTPRERFSYYLLSNKFSKYIPGASHRWWVSAAGRICRSAIETEMPDVICVTVSPFFAAKAAAALAKEHGIPWVLDMRDPWALDPIYHHVTKWHYRLGFESMRRACRAADAVVMNTPRSLEALREAFPKLASDRLFCITNGWDHNDIKKCVSNSGSPPKCGGLTIVHTGFFLTRYGIKLDPTIRSILRGGRKKITDFFRYSPGNPNLLARTPYYLFKAIRKLLDESRISERDIRLVLVGVATAEDNKLVEMFDLENMVEFKGFINHDESIRTLLSADVLFLPLHEPQNGQYPLIVPGKTYEYMAARKPILALVPPGDTRDFVRQSGLGYICDPTNVEQIGQTLLDLLVKHRSSSGFEVDANEEFIQRFERRTLTKELAKVLDFAIGTG